MGQGFEYGQAWKILLIDMCRAVLIQFHIPFPSQTPPGPVSFAHSVQHVNRQQWIQPLSLSDSYLVDHGTAPALAPSSELPFAELEYHALLRRATVDLGSGFWL